MNTESLGDRLKSMYEHRFRISLPRRMYTLIRLDGKSFSNYTRNLTKPFDPDLADDFDTVAKKLCSEIMGCRMAYTQSDEITLVLTDFDSANSDSWFDGDLQKLVSVSASMATAFFNNERSSRNPAYRPAYFDARAFSISDREEVINCLIWRQSDAVRNSISGIARTVLSHKEMDGIGLGELRRLLDEKGVDLMSFPQGFIQGRVVTKETYLIKSVNPVSDPGCDLNTKRTRWVAAPAPKLTEHNIPAEWIPVRPPYGRNSTN